MYDIKAEITLIPTQEGGRRMQTCSGWRPQFHYHEQEEYEDWDTVFLTDDTVEWVYPGQTVAA
jgi:translation elongation factor EF-Tu-like GTPase